MASEHQSLPKIFLKTLKKPPPFFLSLSSSLFLSESLAAFECFGSRFGSGAATGFDVLSGSRVSLAAFGVGAGSDFLGAGGGSAATGAGVVGSSPVCAAALGLSDDAVSFSAVGLALSFFLAFGSGGVSAMTISG